MASSKLLVEKHKDGKVWVLKMNKPDKMNCICPELGELMCQAFDDFRVDPIACVAILTGVGNKAFSAGGDLTRALELSPRSKKEIARHDRGEAPGVLGPSRWTDIYKPMICMVNGVAYAGGLEWACFGDIRIVEEHASFGVTCRRWNIGLADGGTQRLPRIIGFGRAMEMIITGRVIHAEEAYRIGLANEIVPTGKGMERALELAGYISELPQPAILTDKEAAVRGFGRDLQDGLRIEAQCYNRLTNLEDFSQGIQRFIDRSHPDRQQGLSTTPGLIRPNKL